jgi:hypothetical protein
VGENPVKKSAHKLICNIVSSHNLIIQAKKGKYAFKQIFYSKFSPRRLCSERRILAVTN